MLVCIMLGGVIGVVKSVEEAHRRGPGVALRVGRSGDLEGGSRAVG
jgi:hypothetical protein